MLNKKLPFNIKLTEEEQSRILSRYQEFKAFETQTNQEWFSELCFCILTANSQAKRAIEIQNELGFNGFASLEEKDIAQVIKSHGHRFHNNKAKYIVLAREFINIKDLIKDLSGENAREFLAKNIKGLGYKEASHFLRNVGYTDVAIIDRHILKFLLNQNIISSIPKTVTKKIYLELEEILRSYYTNLSILDLVLWYKVTDQVLK